MTVHLQVLNPLDLVRVKLSTLGVMPLQSNQQILLQTPTVKVQYFMYLGRLFVRGHFVFASQQSLVISKYTSTGTATVGFTIAESIVTSSEDTSLFDNQGATPNTASPGADRYRIRLTLANKANISATDNFVYFCDIVDGEIEEVVTGTEDYNKINDVLAIRTKEESGNYIVRPFRVTFEEDSASGSTSNLIANISLVLHT